MSPVVAAVLATVVPVFALVALGWLLGRRSGLDAASLTRLAVDVAAPALVFVLFARMEWEGGQVWPLVGGALAIMGASGLGALALRPLFAAPHRGILLPAIFWNSGNMGLSVVRLGLGDEALSGAAIVFVTVATLNALVGAWIARGRGGLVPVLRMPLSWACLLGASCSMMGWQVPGPLMEVLDMLASMAIPFMLLTLGLTLRTLQLVSVRDAALTVACRMGLGLAAALAFTSLLGLTGTVRQILVLEAVLPPAVINVIFARDHGAAPQVVASSIVLGTLLSVIVLPVVLAGLLGGWL